MQKALDVSNYSGAFGPDTVACWRGQGYEYLICGTQQPAITRRQMEAAIAGGMSVAAYVYLYWAYDIAAQVRAARDTVAGYPVERLWLDCEDDPAGRAPDEIVALITAASAACGDIAHGIYTGRWWWAPRTGNSAAFSRLPLWHAEYTSGADVTPYFDAFRAYGGWTRPTMWQYQGTTRLCGIDVDLNLRDAVPVPPMPDLSAEERWELEVLRAGGRFSRALANGRFALRPAHGRSDAVELVRVDGAGWHAFEPPCILAVD